MRASFGAASRARLLAQSHLITSDCRARCGSRADTYDTLTDFHDGMRWINFSRRNLQTKSYETCRIEPRRARSRGAHFLPLALLARFAFAILISCKNSRGRGDIEPAREAPNIVTQCSASRGVIYSQLPLASVSIAGNIFYGAKAASYPARKSGSLRQ